MRELRVRVVARNCSIENSVLRIKNQVCQGDFGCCLGGEELNDGNSTVVAVSIQPIVDLDDSGLLCLEVQVDRDEKDGVDIRLDLELNPTPVNEDVELGDNRDRVSVVRLRVRDRGDKGELRVVLAENPVQVCAERGEGIGSGD